MDVVVVGGLSRRRGSSVSDNSLILVERGKPMSYRNLRAFFGRTSPGESAPSREVSQTPYLGGMYLYDYLTRRGLRCELVNFLDLERERLVRAVEAGARIVALSTSFLPNMRLVKLATSAIRAVAPDVTLIVGGPLVLKSFQIYGRRGTDYLVDPCADDFYFLKNNPRLTDDIDLFVVEEEGEKALFDVASAVLNGQPWDEIPNLAFYRGDELVFTVRKEEKNAFEDNIIEWDELPAHAVTTSAPVRASKGCPFRCKFCNFSRFRFAKKDLSILRRELESLRRRGGVRLVRFTDDNAFTSRERLERTCKMLIEGRYGFKWASLVRASSITPSSAELLAESGMICAQIGMESGDEEMLVRMNKRDTRENYLRVVELLNRNGIHTQIYFIVGYPGETDRSVSNTIDMVNSFYHAGPAVNHFMAFPFLLAPLAPIYEPEERRKHDLKGYMFDWSHSTMDSRTAGEQALRFALEVRNAYPPYGLDELVDVPPDVLKRISELRARVRRAQLQQMPEDTTRPLWDALRDEVSQENGATVATAASCIP